MLPNRYKDENINNHISCVLRIPDLIYIRYANDLHFFNHIDYENGTNEYNNTEYENERNVYNNSILENNLSVKDVCLPKGYIEISIDVLFSAHQPIFFTTIAKGVIICFRH